MTPELIESLIQVEFQKFWDESIASDSLNSFNPTPEEIERLNKDYHHMASLFYKAGFLNGVECTLGAKAKIAAKQN